MTTTKAATLAKFITVDFSKFKTSKRREVEVDYRDDVHHPEFNLETSARLWVGHWEVPRRFYFSKDDKTLYFAVNVCSCETCDYRVRYIRGLLGRKKISYRSMWISFNGRTAFGFVMKFPDCTTVWEATEALSKLSGLYIGIREQRD